MSENIVIDKIIENIEKVIIGKSPEVCNIIKGIIANGHILIEDVPGVGKTTLVKALAKSINLSYSRIQFTPDLLPSDIIGISIYNQKTMDFEFKKGPIFSNVVLADEINRTSPKTQSALLEVMEEKQVSEGNNTYKLEAPFIVIGTQNPIEYEGTFILPEAQLDRFMIKVKIGYPDKINESRILERYRTDEPLQGIKSVVTAQEILDLQSKVRQITVAESINNYIVDIVDATRNTKLLSLGASPRAALSLQRIAQAQAFINERDYVIPEDVKDNVLPVLSHRVTVSPYARANNYNNEGILKDILNAVEPPKIKASNSRLY